jgi:hypothetical protein
MSKAYARYGHGFHVVVTSSNHASIPLSTFLHVEMVATDFPHGNSFMPATLLCRHGWKQISYFVLKVDKMST